MQIDPSPLREGEPRKQYQRDYFVYGTGSIAIAFGASANTSIQIQADSMFLWESAAWFATVADAAFTVATQPMPNVTVQIIDTGSGRQLFSAAQPIVSLFGDGKLPFPLPTPRYFQPNSQVQIQLANFDAAISYNIRLSLIGSKIFNFDKK